MTATAPLRRDRRPPRRRSRPTVIGVLGEILVTAGVVVMLYVSYQLWVGDLIVGAQRSAVGQDLSRQWADEAADASPSATREASPTATSTPSAAPEAPTADPIILSQPGDGQTFGVLHVPRWGAGYAQSLAGGVSREVTLDPIGIGHYPGTAMPGESGNFAVAGHRTTYGAPFADLQSLHVGDAVVVETEGGWYTYRFRNLEYVEPEGVDVLLPVPQQPDVAADGSYITMTTCSPRFSAAERLIAYGAFESFTPRDSLNTPPSSLALPAGA